VNCARIRGSSAGGRPAGFAASKSAWASESGRHGSRDRHEAGRDVIGRPCTASRGAVAYPSRVANR
jgi:hypothetical protein